MEIICPQCQFSRQVDESKIPPTAQVATCPKCQAKFKFRDVSNEEFSLEPDLPDAVAETKTPESVEPPEAQTPPATRPTSAEPEGDREASDFPKISAPGEDSRDELWNKLDRMAPPEQRESADEKPDAEKRPIPGWNGEFNDEFPDPMHGSERDDAAQTANPQVPPPFEQLDRYGFFPGLFMTIKLVLTSPRLFFGVMPVGGGLAKPLTFTILVALVQSFAQFLWGTAGLTAAMDGPEASLGGMTGAAAAFMMLLLLPAVVAGGQFLVTGIYHVILSMMGAADQGFEGTFRALAYSNAPIVLGLFPMLTTEIEMGWMMIVACWGLFLTATGLKHIHKTSYAKVVPVCLIPLLLAMIAGFMMLQGQMPTV